MNEAGFYKLSMDLRDLARKIPLHWGQVQNNKVDDKINMFDIFHYEELEKQINSTLCSLLAIFGGMAK